MTEGKFQELKRRVQEVREGRFIFQGRPYLSLKRTLQELRVTHEQGPDENLLGRWAREGCRHLSGEKIKAQRFKFKDKGKGTPAYWFLEEHVFHVKASLLKEEAAKRRASGSFPSILRAQRELVGLRRADLASRLGISPSAVQGWEEGRMTLSPDKRGLLAQTLGIAIEELKIPQKRHKKAPLPQHLFDGVFRDSAGQPTAYTIPKAAQLFAIGGWRLRSYVLSLPEDFSILFPSGRLPSEPMLVPGTKNQIYRAIRHDDLETLTRGIARILHDGFLVRHLRTSEQICDLHGVDQICNRILVRRLLRALVENGHLRARPVARKDAGGTRGWRRPMLYDPVEVKKWTGGRDLVELARTFCLAQGDVTPPLPTATALNGVAGNPSISAPRSVGRPTKGRTQELHQFCYEQYVTNNLSAQTVLELANKRFGSDTILEQSTVRIYVRRYAEKNGKTKYLKNAQETR
jgi:transcriptional regulator with XRE-family HTH domain